MSKRLYQRSALLGFDSMNRYNGRNILPCVHAQKWNDMRGRALAADKLWTLRAVTVNGEDSGMPKRLHLSAEDAVRKAEQDQKDYACYVFLYPYFLAEKSGTLTIFKDRATIGAVQGVHPDYRQPPGTGFEAEIEIREQSAPSTPCTEKSGRRLPDCHIPGRCQRPDKMDWTLLRGDTPVLTDEEVLEIAGYLPCMRCECQKEFARGNRVHLKWSFARDSDLEQKPKGDRYLVFFEMKILKPDNHMN